MSKLLTEQDFQIAAKKLRCEIPAIKAVAEIESRGKGFYADGFPVILFERHVFRKFTQGRYNKSHPHLSGPAGNYGAAGQNQRNKFNEAFALNPIAAMKACSWGKFQIMGFNHAAAGFATVGEFVDAMKQSEGEHLLAFVNFVINNNLADELRNKNWTAFARGYNGAGYTKNKYDVKMAAAYRKYAAQKIKVSAAVPATTPVKDNPLSATPSADELPAFVESPSNDRPPQNEQPPINQTAENITNVNTGERSVPNNFEPETKIVEAPPKENSTATATKMTIAGFAVPTFLVVIIQSVKDLISQGFVNAADIGALVLEFIKTNTRYVFYLIGLIMIGLMLKKLWKQITLWIQMYFAGKADTHDVEVKPQ